MAAGRLNLQERYGIHTLRDAGYSLRDIGYRLGRAPSTISRELRCNRQGRRYAPEPVHALSQQRRSRASQRPRIDAAAPQARPARRARPIAASTQLARVPCRRRTPQPRR
jgi:IS30 family transposase